MSQPQLHFKLVDLSAAFASLVKQWEGKEVGSGSLGSMHTIAHTENGVLKIDVQPTMNVSVNGEAWTVWGPCPEEFRSAEYNDPWRPGSFFIEPSGAWGRWVKDKGFVTEPDLRPAATFDAASGGKAVTEGFVPGGVGTNVFYLLRGEVESHAPPAQPEDRSYDWAKIIAANATPVKPPPLTEQEWGYKMFHDALSGVRLTNYQSTYQDYLAAYNKATTGTVTPDLAGIESLATQLLEAIKTSRKAS